MSGEFELTVDLEEVTRLGIFFKQKIRQVDSESKRILNLIGFQINADAVETISHGPTRHGVQYERGGRTATRSAEGEPAKSDEGTLASSMFYALSRDEVEIGYLEATAPHGKYLEDPKSVNRPVLEPVIDQNRGFIQDIVDAGARGLVS